jgi:sirohydrochlorin ferrochelatase
MERRAGPEFDFNEPLLATALCRPPFDTGEVIVVPQFYFPGRHAGPDGDLARICDKAAAENPGRKIHLAPTIGSDPRLIGILAERRAEAREI